MFDGGWVQPDLFGFSDCFESSSRTDEYKSKKRYAVGALRKGEAPSVYQWTDSLYDANREFNKIPGQKMAGFIVDSAACVPIVLMFDDESCIDPDLSSEYGRFSTWFQATFQRKGIQVMSTVRRERDLSDPLERAAYDGFITRKAVVR